MNDTGSPLAAVDTGSSRTAPEGPPLAGLLVVEHGERPGAAVCGALLAQLGADVARIEPRGGRPVGSIAHALGKRSLVLRDGCADDRRVLRELVARADVIVTSSDVSPLPDGVPGDHSIVCDITAFGASGPLAGRGYPDALVQALAGLADTTGEPDGSPALIGFPFCEVSAGIYAAAATLVAHRVRRTRGFGQRIDVALYDCAVSALATFLPFHAIGRPITRSGNGHSLAAPWNAYRAVDGWVLICTATDEQWARLCSLIGRPALARESGFAANAERVARRREVDRIVEGWTAAHSVSRCIEKLSAIDIACGPILTVAQLAAEPNLAHRHMIERIADPQAGELALPGSPLRACLPLAPTRSRVPAPEADRAFLEALLAARSPRPPGAGRADHAPPFAGLRVVEIGQYTTAPLVARQLGALGAEVYKIEPPGGEGSRAWPPLQGDRGYFFAFSNSDKKSLELDLREAADRSRFRALLRTADVLVENLKPGSLARLGFAPEALLEINPRLVYCAISGFGAASAYPGRPAFDTVVQAMSGFMDLTRANGVPMKAGISAADIVGGELGLLAILAALELRDRCGRGRALDLSMQDAAVWASASAWRQDPAAAVIVKCADGHVCLDAHADAAMRTLAAAGIGDCAGMTRAACVAAAQAAGVAAAPVSSVSEAAKSAQAAARELIIERRSTDGRTWPLLNSPMRLARTPPRVERPIGALGEANEVLRALGPDA